MQSRARPATASPLPNASEVDGEIEDWPAGHALPPGYRWDSKPHSALANIGTGLFALGYVPAFAIAASGNDDLLHPGNPQSLWLFAPIAGPFVLLGDARSDFASVLLVADGVFQAVGVGLAAVGPCGGHPSLCGARSLRCASRPHRSFLGREAVR